MTLTFEKFVSSLIRNHSKKFGIYPWDNSTIPIRRILLSDKQTFLYEKLLENKIIEIEKTKDWKISNFRLSKDGRGVASITHKSGMNFSYVNRVKEKSFSLAIIKEKKIIWIKNQNHSFLTIKKYNSKNK